MKKRVLALAGHVGLFCAVLAILWLALTAAAAIPNEAIRANMERSALDFSDKAPFAFTDGQRWSGIQDNYADAILLNVTWHMGEGDPLTAALDTQYYDGEELGENAGLYLAVAGGVAPNTDYTRYWHGSAALLRPLLLVTDAPTVKLLGLVTVLALAGVTAALLWRRRHAPLALALAAALAAVQIWQIRLSLEYLPAFLLCFLLCPLYLLLERRGDRALTLLSVAAGTAVAFFDFLTTETVTVLLPLLLVVAVRSREDRLGDRRQTLGLCVRCGLGWLAAYAGTFLAKWTAATLVTGENKFTAALSTAAERVGGAADLATGTETNLLSPLAANLTVLFGGTARVQPGRVAVGLAVSALALGSVYYLFRGGKGRAGAWLLVALGALVPLRYLVLQNHSFLHEFFTYRAMVCTIFAALAALSLHLAPPGRKGAAKWK